MSENTTKVVQTLEGSKLYLHNLAKYLSKTYPGSMPKSQESWRTLLDHASHEFSYSTISEKKLLILILENLDCMDELYSNYVLFYKGIGREDIARDASVTFDMLMERL